MTKSTTIGPRVDAPRTNRTSTERERKRALLREPHIAPLTDFVERLRAQRRDAAIPSFDPTEAGVAARILLLFEAPGPRAALARRSGFISPDNDDQSAKNMWKLLQRAGIDRGREVVTWNVVPWYVGDGSRIRAVTARDLDAARPALLELLSLLPHLQVVVLFGRKAEAAWSRSAPNLSVDVLVAPHPSPKVINTRPRASIEIRDALKEARRLAGFR